MMAATVTLGDHRGATKVGEFGQELVEAGEGEREEELGWFMASGLSRCKCKGVRGLRHKNAAEQQNLSQFLQF
jgi:hypothetical protein